MTAGELINKLEEVDDDTELFVTTRILPEDEVILYCIPEGARTEDDIVEIAKW